MGLGKFGPGCDCCETFQVRVRGCSSLPLAGATYTFNGTDYTTDASGIATVTSPGAGTYPTSAAKSRFVTFAGNKTITSPQALYNVDLTPAAGYDCLANTGPGGTVAVCADPFPHTIYCTDSKFGDTTALTHQGSGLWSGPATRSIQGKHASCGAATSTISLVMTYFFEDFHSLTGDVAFGVSFGICTGGFPAFATDITPPPASGGPSETVVKAIGCAVPLHHVFTFTPAAGAHDPYPSGSTYTLTFTE